MRALVTGGAGFIGSHLVDALVARGDSVLVLDDLSTGQRHNLEAAEKTSQVEFVEGSILDQGLVGDCVGSTDVCFHLASAVGVKLILERPLDSLSRNVRGTEHVVDAARRHGRRLLFASSSEVYGKDSSEALSEDSDRLLGSPSVLRWSYSTAKAFGEVLINASIREHGCEAVIARLFNTVGPRQAGTYGMVLPRFVRQALAGKPLEVYGDGSQSRCFVHVSDTVEAIGRLASADDALGGTYNVGSDREVTILDLAQQVVERSGSSSPIERIPYERAYGEDFEELGRRKPDLTAVRSAIDWEPTRTLAETIDDTIAHERDASEAVGDPALSAD